jgi:murein DD-endopeptidase MepM/ murein hydrolase activator NlpD
VLIIGPTSAIAIPIKPQSVVASGEPIEPISDELSPEQEQAMWQEIQQNISMLGGTNALMTPNAAQTTALGWPLRMAPGLPDYAGFRISAFVDHNPNSGQVLDYNSGTRTYDSHRGTDIALYPFSWNKVNANEVQVIAAAAGTIVAKANVDPSDHNCIVSSNDPWNYVALVHADGRMTIYGHMRYNSLTSKGIGATVAQGEYLGIVGSSGNSSGPHLHFEVRYGSFSTAEVIDPYAGPASQPTSLWASQRPYYDSAVDRLSTHSAPPSTPDPCQPTTTNLQDSFTTPRNIYFYIYYRDYQGTLPTQIAIYRPDGSIFQSSQYFSGDSAFHSAWSYSLAPNFSASEPAGTWRFEATYNGQTYQTFFNINAPPTLTLSSPNGGEQWDSLLAHPITWADNFGGEVNIALYHNGVYLAPIAYNTPNDGVYMWSAGLGITLGTGYTIRVSSVLNPTISDESNASFRLIPTTLTNREYLPLIQQ